MFRQPLSFIFLLRILSWLLRFLLAVNVEFLWMQVDSTCRKYIERKTRKKEGYKKWKHNEAWEISPRREQSSMAYLSSIVGVSACHRGSNFIRVKIKSRHTHASVNNIIQWALRRVIPRWSLDHCEGFAMSTWLMNFHFY